ncbi:uncharacterized protein LOC142163224 [Nicotiana tabacum]|uniref:Uncharacterized protein LOC142163224 n=1 Tax=Nicotiana tabacum TaxID=4097 RepID=A0AC58RV47_TOBAC
MGRTFKNYNFGNSWLELCEVVERLKPTPRWKIVKWLRPLENRVKINSDSSFAEGKVRIGGVVRYHTGDMIMAYSIPTICSSNNLAEAQATLFGVQWCMHLGYINCDLEMDSLVVAEMLNHSINLKMKESIDALSQIMLQLNCIVSHCFKEANRTADSLVKFVAILVDPCMYFDWQSLPRCVV